MALVEAAFVLAMMEEAQPLRNIPWRDTFPSTAAAIASAANTSPLFQGEDGPAKTAAVMVGVADMESAFNPKAKGDCKEKDDRGMCKPKSIPHSFCAFQVHDSNFKFLGVTEEKLLEDIGLCVRSGLRLMHESFRLCASWSEKDRLNQYATGGGVCVRPKHDEGEHRMRRAMWLYRSKLSKDKKLATSSSPTAS